MNLDDDLVERTARAEVSAERDRSTRGKIDAAKVRIRSELENEAQTRLREELIADLGVMEAGKQLSPRQIAVVEQRLDLNAGTSLHELAHKLVSMRESIEEQRFRSTLSWQELNGTQPSARLDAFKREQSDKRDARRAAMVPLLLAHLEGKLGKAQRDADGRLTGFGKNATMHRDAAGVPHLKRVYETLPGLDDFGGKK